MTCGILIKKRPPKVIKIKTFHFPLAIYCATARTTACPTARTTACATACTTACPTASTTACSTDCTTALAIYCATARSYFFLVVRLPYIIYRPQGLKVLVIKAFGLFSLIG